MNLIKKAARWVKRLFEPDPDKFLKSSRGIIHIGANQGQEREQYARLGLPVVWIEPIEQVFNILQTNITPFPDQRAFNRLITDTDGKMYDFHIANNEGASSSILDFHNHKDIWPEVEFTKVVQIEGVSLPTFLAKEAIDLSVHDALIIDTQGSELTILQGAESILGKFAFIKVEVPDFESYKGCCTIGQMDAFMKRLNFSEIAKHKMATSGKDRNYYDVVYRNNSL